MKNFLIVFFSQFAIYFLIIANNRAFNRDDYFLAGSTDMLFASLQFFIIKRIAKDEDKSYATFTGYVLGGVIGTLVSMYVSKEFLGI